MDSQNLQSHDTVKAWYDGFPIGKRTDIYNLWSIICYLQRGDFDTYWANTSSNKLIGELVRRSGPSVKGSLQTLLSGDCITVPIREDIVYEDLFLMNS